MIGKTNNWNIWVYIKLKAHHFPSRVEEERTTEIQGWTKAVSPMYHLRVWIQKYQLREACDDNCVNLKHNQLHRSIRTTKKRDRTPTANCGAQEERHRHRRLVLSYTAWGKSALTHTVDLKQFHPHRLASDYGLSHSLASNEIMCSLSWMLIWPTNMNGSVHLTSVLLRCLISKTLLLRNVFVPSAQQKCLTQRSSQKLSWLTQHSIVYLVNA